MTTPCMMSCDAFDEDEDEEEEEEDDMAATTRFFDAGITYTFRPRVIGRCRDAVAPRSLPCFVSKH